MLTLADCKNPKLLPQLSKCVSFANAGLALRYAEHIEGAIYVESNHTLYIPTEVKDECGTLAPIEEQPKRQWIKEQI
jgi:hypothetical protein